MNPALSADDANDLVLRPAGTLCLRHPQKVKADSLMFLGYQKTDFLLELTVAAAGNECLTSTVGATTREALRVSERSIESQSLNA